MNKKDKVIVYSLVGVGAIALTTVLVKAAQAKKNKKVHEGVKRQNKDLSLTYKSGLREIASKNPIVPAIAMVYNPKGGAKGDEFDIYEMNYTPRRASTPHNEREFNDLKYLKDPSYVPADFMKLKNRDQMIHPNDYLILQQFGIIPQGFPIDRVEYVRSMNGENEFVVGYSEKRDVDLGRSSKTFKAVYPLWAVSFGKPFNAKGTKPSSITNESEFKETANRVLLAEYMLSRANNGCDSRLGHNLCAAEKNAIISILLERYKVRKAKKKPKSLTYDNIVQKPMAWNPSSTTFTSSYFGVPKGLPDYPATTKQPFSTFDKTWTRRFDDHYAHDLWSMPNFGLTATHFIHYDAMSNSPNWMGEGLGIPRSTVNTYAVNEPIRIGRLAVIDRSSEFV